MVTYNLSTTNTDRQQHPVWAKENQGCKKILGLDTASAVSKLVHLNTVSY